MVKHLAQPDGALGMDAGCDELSMCSCLGEELMEVAPQLQPGTREVRVKMTLHLRQNFVYGMPGALGKHWHKYPTLLGKHHVRE